MTKTAIIHTALSDSRAAGTFLGKQIFASIQAQPDVVILFAAPTYDQGELLQALNESCQCNIIVGCSSAGEFTSNIQGEELACALALCSTEMHFSIGIGCGLHTNRDQAARELISSFQGNSNHTYRYRSALVLTDALAGHTEDLVEHLTLLTAGTYQFFGGGSGDNAHFFHTPVFYNTEVVSDAVVALEILSNKPLGIGVRHGWQPASPGMRVTEAKDMCLLSLNAMPAVEAFQAHAENTHQTFDQTNPLPFFLHNIIGIDTGLEYKLRVPLAVNPDGSIFCAAEIPTGSLILYYALKQFLGGRGRFERGGKRVTADEWIKASGCTLF